MAQQVKSLALSLPWLGSGSYCGANSIPGLGTFICRGDGQKKKMVMKTCVVARLREAAIPSPDWQLVNLLTSLAKIWDKEPLKYLCH